MIDVSIADFVGPPLNASNGQVLAKPVSPLDIARGAVTINRPTVASLKRRSWIDRGAIALQILSVLHGGGPLGLSGSGEIHANLDFLDPSEKGSISYRVGMGVAHVLAKDLLGAVEVGHLDAAKKAGWVTLVSGKRHPDLVGLDQPGGNVLVIEAKGRSNGGVEVDDAIAKAKQQADNVLEAGVDPTTVGPPLYKIASVVDLSQIPLNAHFVDPPNGDEIEQNGGQEPTRLVVDQTGFLRSYYGAIEELAEISGGMSGVPGLPDGLAARGARLPGTRIWLALADPVNKAVQGSDADLVRRVRRAQQRWWRENAMRFRHAEEGTEVNEQAGTLDWTSIGPDGFLLHLEQGALGSS